MEKFIKKTNAGFTLVEILVTVFLFSLAFTATTFILLTNQKNAVAIKNNLIASGLAQEGIEIVRNIRDNDWFLGNPFGTSMPNGTFRVQWDSRALILLGGNPNLNIGQTSGVFSYNFGNPTIFARTLEIETVVPNIEKKVTVTVSWTERGNSRSLSTEEHLFNWH